MPDTKKPPHVDTPPALVDMRGLLVSIYAFYVVFIQDAYSTSTVRQNLNFGTLKLFSLS